MNYEAIERLIKLINDSDLKELELEEAGLRIRMSKNDSSKIIYNEDARGLNQSKITDKCDIEYVNHTNNANDNTSVISTKHEEIITEESNLEECFIVKSPMVGTYYSSPTENGEPYIKIGDSVSKESILCIIEAMKLMNEIECEVEGTVAKIFVNNGDVVEFGQPIMAIKL
ncbi:MULTISPECIES: acetyl-CoA carboxylase biotin carboxyl carrier protein [unclassified Clostridium]|uniref:acetyl-CoA carboxylase biotin carboxyl carrier protein n=1 Tax=unclassified Clostridium TaxID=2614128 RepID=UPI003217C34D